MCSFCDLAANADSQSMHTRTAITQRAPREFWYSVAAEHSEAWLTTPVLDAWFTLIEAKLGLSRGGIRLGLLLDTLDRFEFLQTLGLNDRMAEYSPHDLLYYVGMSGASAVPPVTAACPVPARYAVDLFRAEQSVALLLLASMEYAHQYERDDDPPERLFRWDFLVTGQLEWDQNAPSVHALVQTTGIARPPSPLPLDSNICRGCWGSLNIARRTTAIMANTFSVHLTCGHALCAHPGCGIRLAWRANEHAEGAEPHCPTHCTCPACTSCGSRRPTPRPRSCNNEAHCGACCNCPTMFRPASIHFTPKPVIPTKKDLKTNKMARLLGVEVEIAGIPAEDYSPQMAEAVKKWKPHFASDGSLHSKHYSVEMPTQPTGGDLFLQQQADLSAGLISMECYQNQTAGMHVHVDCKDVDAWDMSRVLRLYADVEPALFSLLHVSRTRNTFCLPCADRVRKLGSNLSKNPAMDLELRQYGIDVKLDEKGRISDFKPDNSAYWRRADLRNAGTPPEQIPQKLAQLLQDRLKQLKKNKGHPSRYNALNFHSYFFRGTLEFRHHHGSINKDTMTYWPLICGSIVEWAKTHSDADLLKLPVTIHKAELDPKFRDIARDLTFEANGVSTTVASADVARSLMMLARVAVESTGITEIYDWMCRRLAIVAKPSNRKDSFTSYGSDGEI